MTTHKHINLICCVVLSLTLVLTVFLMALPKGLIAQAGRAMGYENKLFDTASVHTIDIEMENWEEFLNNCKSEEYYTCSLVIDGESYPNVAIRGKGNTSLTQVDSYGNDRYSFKVEFDHYDSSVTYHGLDKLVLNNIIQDNTYMKDFLTYQMMGEMGVAAPLCSYVYITVNGEDWGLYLAIEGVEESFLQRNYSSNYGELYKPDSMNMGGGRGNGKEFRMEDFEWEGEMPDMEDMPDFDQGFGGDFGGSFFETGGQGGNFGGDFPEAGGQMPDFGGEMPEGGFGGGFPETGGQMPDFGGGQGGNFGGGFPETGGQMPDFDGGQGGNFGGDFGGGFPETGGQMPDFGGGQGGNFGGDFGGEMPNFGGFGGMGSDDVLLRYIDDDYDSYRNIFDSAKTSITNTDKTRLINALKNLSNGNDLSDTVDIDAVIRYFVVHNFVLNFDSYTGSMIHNYYLYEKDGQLQMIPWDYNLAFGGFESGSSATSLVNYPIDSPVSGGDAADRPMIAWIFAEEEYTELYHQYFAEFVEQFFTNGEFTKLIDDTATLIAPYVEKDPTAFCTFEEFETGVATLRQFCLLRAESISGQLSGTIGSTTETQDTSDFIDASELTISDMGSMGFGGGKGRGSF